jgi:hypothetical protein
MKFEYNPYFVKEGIIVVFLGILTFFSRYFFKSQSIDMYDVAMFAFGSNTFTPIHSPGYPVLLLFARFFDFFTGDTVNSLIYISIFSSVLLVIATYFIARIFFKDQIVSIICALLLLVQPTVWLFGIIGMSDMLQATCVSLVVVFCAAAFHYKKSGYLYIASFLFAITLGVKISHFLLVPLILYTIIELHPRIIDIVKSGFSFLLGLALWGIPFYTLMDRRYLQTENLVFRDAGNYNILVIGFFNKIQLLLGKSAFSHFKNISLFLCALTLLIIFLCICYYLWIKEKKELCICLPYTIKGISEIIAKNKTLVFFALWIISYVTVFFLFFSWQPRYYLPIYPAIIISFVWLSKSTVQLLDFNKKSVKNNILKSIINNKIILFLCIVSILGIFSTYVSIVTLTPFHNEVDTRSQTIYFTKEISSSNALNGQDTYVYINSIWDGRMAFRAYMNYYNVSEFNSPHFIEFMPFSKVPEIDQMNDAECDLLNKMNANSGKNSKIYLVGDLVSQLSCNDRVFQLKLLKIFSRSNEWIVDDPHGEIRLYEYEKIGNSIWPEIQNSSDYSQYPLAKPKIETMEDDAIYPILFSPTSEIGEEAINFSLNVPKNESEQYHVKIMYGFVKGANQTNGVKFSMLLNGVEQFSETKRYTGKLSTYDLDLTKNRGENVTISLIVDSNGNTAYDWSSWVMGSNF